VLLSHIFSPTPSPPHRPVIFQVLTSKELWAAEAVRLQHEREARDRKVAEEQAIKLRTVRPHGGVKVIIVYTSSSMVMT